MRFLKKSSVLRIHENLKRDFPISNGKIREGTIEMILDKLTLKLYGSTEKYDTIYKKAACLFEGFCRGHAFPDGNKRTALMTTFAFLQANDHYLVVPLNTVEFLVRVARDKGKTEEEIDALIYEISEWLEQRTATNEEEFEKLTIKFIRKPLKRLFYISLTIVGIIYVNHILNKWMAAKFHPEYKQQFWKVTKFLLGTIDDSKKALGMIKKK